MASEAPASGASALSWAIAGAILGATAMWFLSTLSDLSSTSKTKSGSTTKSKLNKSWPNNYDVKLHPDSSDEELMERLSKETASPSSAVNNDSDSDADASTDEDMSDAVPPSTLSSFSSHALEECKLVLVVRGDLKMTKGKIAAQCSHATLACYKSMSRSSAGQAVLKRWESYGQAKIAVQAPEGGEEPLNKLRAKARDMGLAACVIHDAGRTQIAAGSATVLGVGPGPKSVVDKVTGDLKLL